MVMTENKETLKSDDSAIPVEQASEIGPQAAGSFGYYSVKELAKIIGFHQDTVYEWIAKKGMPVRRSGFKGRITVYWPEFIKWWSREGEDAI